MSSDISSSQIPQRKGVVGIAILGICILAAIWGIASYNSLVTSREKVKTAWSQVEVVVQRRFDLIPNLVSTVKGYAEHEKEVFENVARMRSQWSSAQSINEKADLANGMESAISRLLVIAENYPDLKANQNFQDLQAELAGTENRIGVERQRYNEAVRNYDTQRQLFPRNLIANLFGFREESKYFDAAPEANQVPKVDFSQAR